MTRPAPTVAIVTASDTRGPDDDAAGDLAQRILEADGATVSRHHCPDEVNPIQETVYAAISEADAVIVTGGTGLAPRDVTPEALAPMFHRTIPGYGERLRRLSESDVGPLTILSRAEAGTVRHEGREVPCFATPGSPAAVELAVTQVIVPVLRHLTDLVEGSSHAHH